MSFPAYPEYKESGIPWLGKVPSHWDITRLQFGYELRNGWPFDSDYFQPNGETHHRLFRIRDIIGEAEPAYTAEWCPDSAVIRDGDVLIGMDGDFRVLFWQSGYAKLNQRVCAVRGNRHFWNKFVFYMLPIPLDRINRITFSTTVKHLSSNDLLKLKLPRPTDNEAAQIVRFLDHETARIDALIEEQQRLIELLKEKRQAVISHAVTKGLDPDVPMKDSGVEWIGSVPQNWSIVPIRSLVDPKVSSLADGDWVELPYITEEGIRLIQTGNIGVGYFKEQGYRYISDETFALLDCTEVDPDDILVCRLAEPVGRACKAPLLTSKMIASVDICIIKPKNEVLSDFIVYLMSSHQYLDFMNAVARGGTRQRISRSFLANVRIPLPSKADQKEIVNFIESKVAQLDSLKEEAEAGITLLKERRSALISSAVTGKIDVRDWEPVQGGPEIGQSVEESMKT